MFKLFLFGPPRLEVDGTPIQLATSKVMALLAYLAVTAKSHSRATLATLLWPDLDRNRAHASLRNTLWALRKELNDNWLHVDRNTIGLHPDGEVWIDVGKFRARIAQYQSHNHFQDTLCEACLHGLEEAVELYHDEFMAGFSLPDSLEFDEWQLFQSENLRHRLVIALEALIACHSALSRPEAAVIYARRWVALDPLHEPAQRSLMRAYALAGQRASAIRQYLESEQILQNELGAVPSEETFQLHEAIKAGTITRSTTSPSMTKHDTGPLVAGALKAKLYQKAEIIIERPRKLFGRDLLLGEIHELLNNREHVLLSGFGGIGKTSVAATIVAERIAAGNGGAIWLEAGDENVDTLFEALARGFGQEQLIASKRGDERVIAIRELLSNQDSLLVLDNVWNDQALFQMTRAVPQTIPMLVTSRHVVPLDGEIVHVNKLASEHALELLSYHARQDYSRNPDAVDLCDRLGHHPFALEIAGKRLKVEKHLTPARLLKHIADTPHSLSIPGDFADPSRKGIKDLLDDSVNALDDETRDIFVTMGTMFAPSATLELLAEVARRDEDKVVTAVITLQQQGLAEVVHDAPAHYRIHDLTHSYVRALFKREGRSRRALVEAVQQYVINHAHDFDHLEFEQNNILGTARTASQTDNDEALIHIMKALAMDGYIDARGHTLTLLHRLDEAIEAAQQTSPAHNESLHYMLSKRANAHADRGDLESALQSNQAALECAPSLHRKAVILNVIGGIRFRQGADDYDEYLEEAYQIAEETNDDEVLCRVLEYRGICAMLKSEYQAARRFLIHAIEVAERIADSTRLFYSLYNLGIAEVELGHFNQALSILKRAYQIAHDADNHYSTAQALSGMARGYHGLGERQEAAQCLEEALVLYDKCGAITKIAWVLEFTENENYQLEDQKGGI